MVMPAELSLISLEENNGTANIIFSGDWRQKQSVSGLKDIRKRLNSGFVTRAIIKTDNLERWDSRLVVAVNHLTGLLEKKSIPYEIHELPPGVVRLQELSKKDPTQPASKKDEGSRSFFLRVGKNTVKRYENVLSVFEFLGEQILECLKILLGKEKLRIKEVAIHMHQCGPAALPIVTLIALLVGFILAFIAAAQLERFGAEIYMANLVSVAMFREMGAVMASVILAGRTGAAYAASLGAMQVNEEVDALTSFGISPGSYLVLPRVLALVFMMPLLCLYADVIGVLGGGIVGIGLFDFSINQYLEQVKYSTTVTDVFVGLIKSVVFGLLVALAGCYTGMRCKRTASAVGDATTSAVVFGIILIVVSDAFFAIMFHFLDM